MADNNRKSFSSYDASAIPTLKRIIRLRELANNLNNKEFKYVSPENAAIVQREDWGIPEGQDAFFLPRNHLRKQYPTMSEDTINKLYGSYIVPNRIQRNDIDMEEYLKGHEGMHEMLATILDKRDTGRQPGVGNKGYLPVKSTPDDFKTRGGMENWLLNYSPRMRDEERAAHLAGLSRIGRELKGIVRSR